MGLLDEILATGCPALEQHSFDLGPIIIAGGPHAHDDVATAIAPHLTVLDKILDQPDRSALQQA